jgi:hypothetical protein
MSSRRQREPVGFQPSNLREVEARDLAIRFAFGATISALAALIGTRFGPLAGGAFLAFPAILPAALTLIAQKESTRAARHDSRGAVAGVIGLAAFALTIRLLWERPGAGLAVASAAWTVVAVTGYVVWRSIRTAAGLEESLPETKSGPGSTRSAQAAREARRKAVRASRTHGTDDPSVTVPS